MVQSFFILVLRDRESPLYADFVEFGVIKKCLTLHIFVSIIKLRFVFGVEMLCLYVPIV
jgi:hypothetical protein